MVGGVRPSRQASTLSQATSTARTMVRSVSPPMCGESTTCSIDSSGLPGSGGSSASTSRPALARWPEASASISAASSTTSPRQVFIR